MLVAGTFAGGLNAMAGGASFLTFPALIFAGLPPIVANATNYIALMPGNIAALPAYKKELQDVGRAIIAPLIIAALGGTVGALLLLWLGAGPFETAVPYLMGVATLSYALAPTIRKGIANLQGSFRGPSIVFLTAFSIYGGYFGAGLGPLMLAAMTVLGYDNFHVANALKNATIAALSVPATLIFAFSGIVSWPHGLTLMVGAALGGYFGARFARKVSPEIMRWGVIVFGFAMTLYFFFLRG